MRSDIEIARAATAVADRRYRRQAGCPADALIPMAATRPRSPRPFLNSSESRPDGKLILVTAMSPTPAGEGKTTTTIGLGDATEPDRQGARRSACASLRLAPASARRAARRAGAWRRSRRWTRSTCTSPATSTPSSAAHNLLAAMVDNHLYWGNALELDPRGIAWRRVMDMNDRVAAPDRHRPRRQRRRGRDRLRHHRRLRGHGDPVPGARSATTCAQRLGRIIVGYNRAGAHGDLRRPARRPGPWRRC